MVRNYFHPKSLNEALNYKRDNKQAVLLAGGTDLITAINKDKGPKGSIIDLSKIKELKKIVVQSDKIIIGSMATFTDLIDSEILNNSADIICQAARAVGSPQIRNRGTIGGNICNASPAADLLPVLFCLDGRVELQSIDQKESLKILVMDLKDFILGGNKILIKNNEILTRVIVNITSNSCKTHFSKIGRRNALVKARVNGACVLEMDKNIVSKISLVLGSVAPKPEKLTCVEEYLTGNELSKEVLKKAGTLASDYILKKAGSRPSNAYKIPMIAKFTESLLENTIDQGGIIL